MTDRDRMAAAGLVPVSFEAPPPDHGCAGTWRPFKSCFVALCHTCQRFGKGGPQIDPAARIVHAGARCLNYVESGVAGEMSGVCAESNHGSIHVKA